MTQKSSSEKLVATLLQSIDPKQIADEGVRQTVELLLNLIEQLNVKIKELEEENQKLRDENNRLKGEQGKADIKANKKKGLKKDYSSEKERSPKVRSKNPKEHSKTSKNQTIKIDREEIVVYPQEQLPADAQFKGYEEVVVQDILLNRSHAVRGRDLPSRDKAYELELEFWKLFAVRTQCAVEKTGYEQLDERKRLTALKVDELLLVLEHPELPLHNNPAELAARTMVQRCNISYATQTEQGTKAWDIFMSRCDTTRKLGISFFEYMRDRISQIENIPPLGTMIREKSSSNPYGWSWMSQ